MTGPAAVVFDCDGTLIDTEPISDASWSAVLARHGVMPTADDFAAVLGRPFERTHAYFAGRGLTASLEQTRTEVREEFVARFDAAPLFDDAVATARALAADGVPLAVCTSSVGVHLDRVLARAPLAGLFAARVASEDTSRHKPDPDPYLEAARRLGVAPEMCVAIEDSPVGLAAAIAAGMATVAVVRGHTPVQDLADADLLVERVDARAVLGLTRPIRLPSA